MASLSSILHLQGLPPLPRSLRNLENSPSGPPFYPYKHFPRPNSNNNNNIPQAPPRPHSRKSSSSGSNSFRASPINSLDQGRVGGQEGIRSSPRSLSSSPHSPHFFDSGIGRSSADSFSEPKAFVRVVKSPPPTRLDMQLHKLKSDLVELRQQDLQLLGQLLLINQQIQDLKGYTTPPPPAPAPTYHPTPQHQHQYLKQGGGSGGKRGAKKLFGRSRVEGAIGGESESSSDEYGNI